MSDSVEIDVSEFNKELTKLINTHGLDKSSGIEDFLLSKFMIQSIPALVEYHNFIEMALDLVMDSED